MTTANEATQNGAATSRLGRAAVWSLLFGGPFMMDLSITLLAFFVNMTIVRMGYEPRYQCMLSMFWALGYSTGAHLSSRWVTARNASNFLLVSLAGMVAISLLLFNITPSYWIFLAGFSLTGVLIGIYFCPFQVKMGHIHPFKSMATAVAAYNTSWGLGFACGPFLSGILMDMPHTAVMASTVIVVVSAIQVALLLIVKCTTRIESLEGPPLASEFASSRSSRRMGWSSVLVLHIMLAGLISTLWPNLGKDLGLSDSQIGLSLMVSAVQVPLWAFLWARFHRHMQNPRWLLGALGLGSLGFVTLPMTTSWPCILLAMSAMGMANSVIIFQSVYFSNADPDDRERSVGTNEVFVGVAAVGGPLLMGMLAWNSAQSFRPYAFGLFMGIVAIIVMGRLLRLAGK